MDDSGRIYDADKAQRMSTDYKRALGLIEIPKAEESAVRGMNRKQRRAWYARKRAEKRRGAT